VLPGDVEAATAELTVRYQLDDDQRPLVYAIEQTRLNNLAAIEALERDNSQTYWQKRRAIVLGEEQALDRILRPEQRQILQEQRLARRIAESDLVRELKAQGYSKERIRMEVLRRY
jgi:hypothetical protein